MNRKVSVIIPTHNCAGQIRRALDNVARQTYADREVIVVDDASTDGTAELLKQIEIAELHVNRHPVNRGAAAARNTGISMASGRWIAFLDSDDGWEPEKLARQVAAMEGASSIYKGCCTGYYLHRGSQTSIFSPTAAEFRGQTEILFGCKISPGSTLMVDRQIFHEIGFFDEELRRLEDWDWLLRYFDRYDLVFVPEPLANVYQGGPLAPRIPDEQDPVLLAIEKIRSKHFDRLRARNDWSYRQLRSSLMVEVSARYYHKKRPFRAAYHALMSLFIYPFRNAEFFATLWQRTFAMPLSRGVHERKFP